jgi:hypothetical protein
LDKALERYQEWIRQGVEADRDGEFTIINLETRDYALGSDPRTAVARAKRAA